jgi:hypothetical protein
MNIKQFVAYKSKVFFNESKKNVLYPPVLSRPFSPLTHLTRHRSTMTFPSFISSPFRNHEILSLFFSSQSGTD